MKKRLPAFPPSSSPSFFSELEDGQGKLEMTGWIRTKIGQFVTGTVRFDIGSEVDDSDWLLLEE